MENTAKTRILVVEDDRSSINDRDDVKSEGLRGRNCLRWLRCADASERQHTGSYGVRSQYASMSGFELLSVVRRRYPQI